MTTNTSYISFVIGNTVRIVIRRSAAAKPPRTPSLMKSLLVLMLITIAVIAIGMAAMAGDASDFDSVRIVWLEIKPVLMEILKLLKP
jgi:uncharacterized membrane protein YoaK (UPF0700 family)